MLESDKKLLAKAYESGGDPDRSFADALGVGCPEVRRLVDEIRADRGDGGVPCCIWEARSRSSVRCGALDAGPRCLSKIRA